MYLISKADANARLTNGTIIAPAKGFLVFNASSVDSGGYSLTHIEKISGIVDYLENQNTHSEIHENVKDYSNGYIFDAVAIGTNVNTRVYDGAYKCKVIPCRKDDYFIISGLGGGSGRIWAFTDSDYVLTAISPANIRLNEVKVIVPNDGYLIVNFATAQSYDLTHYIYNDSAIKGLQTEVEKSTNDIRRGEMPTMQPLVSFIDDDGSSRFKTTIQPIIEAKNIPFVLAVPTNASGLTVSELKYLQSNDGCEIVSHTHNHVSLATLTEAQLEAEFKATKEWLNANGFTDDILVYPNGSHNLLVRNVAKRYFRCAIDIENGYNYPPIYQFSMYRQAFCDSNQTEWTLSDYTNLIDYIVAHGGWIIFKVHCHYETFSGEMLEDLIDYIKTANIAIVTISEGLKTYGNTIEIGDYSQQKTNGGAKGGIAVSISGHTNKGLDFTANPLPIDAPIDMYHIGGVTGYFYDNSAVSGQSVPDNIGGNLFTVRSNNDYGSFQLWLPYANDKMYKRRWNFGQSAWGAWTQI